MLWKKASLTFRAGSRRFSFSNIFSHSGHFWRSLSGWSGDSDFTFSIVSASWGVNAILRLRNLHVFGLLHFSNKLFTRVERKDQVVFVNLGKNFIRLPLDGLVRFKRLRCIFEISRKVLLTDILIRFLSGQDKMTSFVSPFFTFFSASPSAIWPLWASSKSASSTVPWMMRWVGCWSISTDSFVDPSPLIGCMRLRYVDSCFLTFSGSADSETFFSVSRLASPWRVWRCSYSAPGRASKIPELAMARKELSCWPESHCKEASVSSSLASSRTSEQMSISRLNKNTDPWESGDQFEFSAGDVFDVEHIDLGNMILSVVLLSGLRVLFKSVVFPLTFIFPSVAWFQRHGAEHHFVGVSGRTVHDEFKIIRLPIVFAGERRTDPGVRELKSPTLAGVRRSWGFPEFRWWWTADHELLELQSNSFLYWTLEFASYPSPSFTPTGPPFPEFTVSLLLS